MSVSVVFPKFNLEKSSGEISNWLVEAGDQVTAGQVLFEVEDDKAAVEVDSPADGFIGGLEPSLTEIDVGAVVAHIFETKEEALAAVKDQPAAAAPTEAPSSAPTPAPNAPAERVRGKTPSTPLARRLARDNGVSLDGLVGTGPRGRIQRRDVLAQLAAGTSAASIPRPALAQAGASDAPSLHRHWFTKGTGLTKVFIHGFSGDLTGWNPLVAAAQYSSGALGIDLPCHGQSEPAVPADLDAIAASVEKTLLEEGVQEALLIGHSFGGAVAARVAQRGRLLVRGQCLIAPAGLGPSINTDFVSGMSRARTAESLQPWLDLLVHDTSMISPAFVDFTLSKRQTEAAFQAIGAFADAVFPDQTQRFNILGDLAQAPGPVRVIFGRQDRILSADNTRNLPGNVATHLLDQCGHMPQLEHRAQTLSIIDEVARSC